MDVGLLEEVLRDSVSLRIRADEREGRLRRLFHHVAELSGELQLARAVHLRRLDEEDFAADARPGEPGRDSGLLGPLSDLARIPLRPEKLAHVVFRVDGSRLDLPFGDLDRDSADDARDLPLESTDARLASVLIDDDVERSVGEHELLLGDAVLLDLLGDEVLLGDRHLLAPRVAGDLEDLHAVAERRGDRIGHVRRRQQAYMTFDRSYGISR